MAKYPKDSHWNDIALRQLAGGAIYVEISLSAGEWDRDKLELIIDKRNYDERTGKYRKMPDGNLPRCQSCLITQDILQCGHIVYWREHPYWPLLCSTQTGARYIDLALRSVKGRIRRNIWSVWSEKGEIFRCTRSVTNIDSVKAVSKFGTFDALVVLTAWAREARAHNILRPNYQASLFARNIFAKVVCNTPHLFIRWPLLADIYKNLIWSAPDTEVSEPWMPIRWDALIEEMTIEERKARNRGVKLPPRHIFEQINEIDLTLIL